MSFLDIFKSARAEVRRHKRSVPHLFPEWQRLQAAEAAHRQAIDELRAARKAWKRLGAR